MRKLARAMAFVVLSVSFYAAADAATVQPHYAVESTAAKCAGRLATWALIDLGYKGEIRLGIRQSSPADNFTLVGMFKSKGEIKKLIGRIVIQYAPVYDDENKQTGFGCTYKESEQLQFHIRVGTGDGSEVVHRPAFSKEKRETKCILISGIKHDDVGAFENYLEYIQEEKFNLSSLACQIADSWVQADQIIAQQIKDPNGTPIKKILFIEAAHGSSGGLSSSNAFDENGASILKILNRHAKAFPVTAIVDSCFSGDLIGRKIVADSRNEELESIDQLCLMTTSTFGTSAVGMPTFLDIPRQLQSTNLNYTSGLDLFSKLKNIMLISSSPWAEIDFDKHLTRHGSIIKDSMPEECSDLFVDMRLIGDEFVEDRRVNKFGRAYQNFIEHLATTKCKHDLSIPISYIDLVTDHPEKLQTTEGMSIIFAAITWSDAEFEHGLPSFSRVSRAWSKGTLNTPRVNELDQRRYQACAKW